MHGPMVRKGAQFLMGETHAGPAWYLSKTTMELTVGSQLIDLDALDHQPLFADRTYRAVFCEQGKPPSIVVQLRRSIKGGGFGTCGQIDVLEGPFERTLPEYLESLSGWHWGVRLVDANGAIADDLVDTFQNHARELHNVNFAIRHQAHVRRRFSGLSRQAIAPSGKWHGAIERYHYRPLRDLLPDLGKRRWLIRRSFNAGFGAAWTMLVGSNWENLPEWRADELYRPDSLTGKAVLVECDG